MISQTIPAERRPFQLDGNNIGVLMLHGFMGSPRSNRPLSDYLYEASNYTIHSPLLSGHGHLPSKLRDISHKTWIAEADSAFATLQAVTDRVFIVAHSMGCTLAAHLAERHKDESDAIEGVVLLAPLYKVPKKVIYGMSIVRHFMPYVYPLKQGWVEKSVIEARIQGFAPDLDLADPAVQANLNEWSKLPTSALDEMRKMAGCGRQSYPHITQPTLILQGEMDEVVAPALTQTLYGEITADDKKLIQFDDGVHGLMRPGYARHIAVWEQIAQFIPHHSSFLQRSKTP